MDLEKTGNFSSKLPCLGICMNFSQRSCKKCLIPWKRTRIHRSGQNYATFSNKLRCFGVSMNFSAKGCRKWINSWKSTKNHRFGQNFDSSRTNYHVFAFRWTFQEKVAESASFREEKRETIDLARTGNFSRKLRCLGIFRNFSERSCKKCLIPRKSTKIHRFGQNFASFQRNYHVFAFRLTFQEKVAKSASFREEKRETIDLARTGNFSSKLPCLGIFMNFSERSCKKCLISWESTRNNRFHQNLQLFEKTTMFGWTLWQKVAKTASFREKARKLMDLAETMQLFPTNYHVLVFRWTVEEKFAKSCSIREKERKIIDLAKTMQVYEQTAMSLHFDELFGKNLQKMPHFVKNHEKSSIWQKLSTFRKNYPLFAFSWTFEQGVEKIASFCGKVREFIDLAKTMQLFLTNYHVLVLRWTFQQKFPESGSIREKARKIIDLAKTLQLFKQTTMSSHFDELFRKKLQQVPHFVRKHEKPSIWPKLSTFRKNYPFLAFSWTFEQGVEKIASFRGKAPKSMISRAFSRNEALFATSCWKVHENAKTW